MTGLSSQEQQVLDLIEEDYKYREIADMLGVHIGTIARVVHRIKDKGYLVMKGVNFNSTRYAAFSFQEW